MRFSIITINFKKPLVTLASVASVYTNYQKHFEKNEWEILVIDNNSEDDSVKNLEKEIREKKYKNVNVFPHKNNNGFGGGNNFGATYAKGDVILFLNNDTLVKKGLDDMLSYFESHESVSILGGPLKNNSGSIQSSAGKFYTVFRIFLLLLGLQRYGFDANPLGISRIDWVKGALLMIRKKLFADVNGFDERIFMYTEDIELCYRVTQLGGEVWFYPDIEVVHEDQGSSSRTFAIVHIYEGILYFYQKHRSKLEYFLVRLLLQSKAYILILLGRLIKNTYLVSTYEKALSVC